MLCGRKIPRMTTFKRRNNEKKYTAPISRKRAGDRMAKVVGVTYPIPKQFIDRFFKGKDVFIKPATVWRLLRPGMKFVFY